MQSPDIYHALSAATAEWAEAFTDDTPERLLALYDQEAILWGTFSPKRRDNPKAIRDYFVGVFAALLGHKVSFGHQLIRVYGDTAINTGDYAFSYIRDSEIKTLPARYSFTYLDRGGQWKIVDHHSSAMPTPLEELDRSRESPYIAWRYAV
ncbi:MAG TPA: DUF4440 domain-containing protein [Candidatus Acidoferrales bacterium]|nr:DUF4440 domain-containing protein [Candidatus Acidoferrales bacterium]